MTTNNTRKIVILLAVLIIGATMSGCIDSDNLGTSPSTEITSMPTASAIPVERGTYYNPTPLNRVFTCYTDGFQMAIVTTSRGEEINSIIKNGNMFNSDPKSGYEYAMVTIVFQNIGEDKCCLSGYDFTAYANDVECSDPFVVLSDQLESMELGSINVMPGGNTLGIKIFEIPIGEQVTVCYDRIFETSYYFDIGSETITMSESTETISVILGQS